MAEELIAGAAAGVSQVIFGHPLDTIKVLLQNGKSWRSLSMFEYYRGFKYPLCSSVIFNMVTFTVYHKTIETTKSSILSGALSGIVISPILFCFDIGKIKRQTNQTVQIQDIMKTKGLYMTFIRETFAMSIYFGSYNFFKKETNSIVAGGLAGLCNWTLTYPFDIIRSRQIAQNISIMNAIAQKNLWRGYSACIIRAVIVNAACFYTYETTYNKIKDI